MSYKSVEGNINYEQYLERIRSSQKLYNVGSFASKDFVSSATDDTNSWKRFAITGAFQNMAVVFNAKDSTERFNYNFDSAKHLLTLISPADTSKKCVFNYSYTTKNGMILTGNWKNKPVRIDLDYVDINSFILTKDKTQWMYSAGVTP